MQPKMKKESALLQGKGEVEEWITVNGNHIPVDRGQSREEAIKQFIQKKEQENKFQNAQKEKDGHIDETKKNAENLPKLDKNTPPPDEEAEELNKQEVEKRKNEVEAELKRRWQETWGKLNDRQKRQAIKLLNTNPIQFDIGEKVLNIAFNEITIGKNLRRKFKSDKYSFNWKHKNIDKFSEVLNNLKFDHTSRETGKNDPSHYGVKEWHYLVGEYTNGDKTFKVIANIADKGDQQFLYDLRMEEIKKELTQK